jgi:hypothetical protein
MDYEITSILHMGTQEVVTIETTSKTYLANGMIAHNCEDLDYHRRLMLAGEGARIFSVNLPYLHYASATLKALPEQDAVRIRQQIEQVSRAYYARKWGGPVNHETYWYPFDRHTTEYRIDPVMLAVEPPTTPELQRIVQQHASAPFLTEADALDKLLFDTNTKIVEDLQARVDAGELLSDRENDALQGLHGLHACDPAADITGMEDWRQPRTCGQMVPTGTGSTTCQRPQGHEGVCSGSSWTEADRQRALAQPEDLDE